MARYTGPVCRLCRREGEKLFLKGDRCFSDKCSVVKRGNPPGEHGQGRRKVSEYGLQLREKQKARRSYGILERQFRRYFEIAERQRGMTGANLLQLLERRLDNVVFRLGFASSRVEARQLVRHGHFQVNRRKVNIPSYLVREGDLIAVKETSRQMARFQELAQEAATRAVPEWLTLEPELMRGTGRHVPTREEIDVPIAEHLIVELYSR
jgi:small subunit ribosomal protein S4